MKAIRTVWLFVLLASATLLAQGNPVPSTDRPGPKVKSPSGLSQPDPAIQGKISQSYGKLPLSFEANHGQADARVKFLSRGAGYTLFLTGDEAVFSLRGNESDFHASRAGGQLQPIPATSTPNTALRMRLVKANRAAQVTGADELPGKSNYFIGNDPKKWHSNVLTFAKVKYHGIYSGIDLAYYGNQRQLEYDFVVAPGANPRRIEFDVRGAKSISQDKDGDLVLQMGEGEVRWHKPVVYQEKDGARQEIAAHYLIKGKRRVGFKVGDYDSRRTLFIDPLVYSTFLGGSAPDWGYAIAVDSSGDAYVTGYTGSANFPTLNPVQANFAGGNLDAFVTKFNPSGSALVYSTYLGGSGQDVGFGIAVDSVGNAYITGTTYSTDFPTMNPLQPNCGDGGGTCEAGDAFVAELNPAGSALVYSTYLGGYYNDQAYGIAVDGSGNAYVTGDTTSSDFPTMNPLQPTFGGGIDAFVSKLNPTGSALVYSTYLGGSAGDFGQAIAVDSSGNAYVAGYTSSTNFPTMNPLQPTYGGGNTDAFVAQLNSTGSVLVYSTYLGGSADDFTGGIAVDGSGNAYVAGWTSSTNFPTMNPLQPANAGRSDAFVAQLNPTGSALLYSTYLGGSGDDEAEHIAVDSSGNPYVTGATNSTNFPTMNPLQPAFGGGGDAFVTKLNAPGSALVYSTYLGGGGLDTGYGLAVDSAGNAYVTGVTSSSNFPTMNPLQPACGDGNTCNAGDAFVTKIAKPSPVATLVPPNLDFGNQTVSVASTPQVVTLTESGELTLTISSINVTGANSGDFAENNNCGASVAPFTSCSITVTFTPEATGSRTASLNVTDNASGSPQTIPLTGVGVPTVVTLSPSSQNFGQQPVGTTSAPQIVQLSATGPVSITSIATSAEFSQTNTCGGGLPTGGSCQISATFTPSATGLQSGTLTITDNATAGPQVASLSGTGTQPTFSFSPTSMSFASQYVGTSGLPQTLTVTNTGTSTLTITNVASSIADFGTLSNCTNPVPPNANCTIGVFFDPTASGTRTGTLTLTDNATGSPQTVTVSGTGQDFSMSPSGQTTATVSPGQTASYALSVAPGGGFNQTVAMSCSGAPAQSTCSLSSSSVALNGSKAATVTVTVTTAGTSAGLSQPFSRPPNGGGFAWIAFSGTLGLAMLLSLAKGLRARRPQIVYGLVFLCLLSIGVTMSACGSGSNSGGGGGGGGTPVGSYNLEVTGTFSTGSTTLTHTTKLTLVVQ
jgi:hypothetical protein